MPLNRLLPGLIAGAALLVLPSVALAAEPPAWYEVGAQATAIDQQLFAFRSPYQGLNSLSSDADNALSHTYTLYFGIRPIKGLEFYLNPEMARGFGVGNAMGLAGYTNGDVIRNPSLSQDPYVARAFLRTVWGLGSASTDVAPGENQIGGALPSSRVQLTLGKFGTNDVFDTNAYADSTRTQFENWDLINGAAYDYAADTRGYSVGAALEWIHPDWTLRVGSLQMPAVANGPDLDPDLANAHGDQLELEVHPSLVVGEPAALRLLAYQNHARMGNYQASLREAGTGTPDITRTRQTGALKTGFELNWQQALADNGDTGLFSRMGWNDGQTESFAYTEADEALSFGGQLSGAHWGRSQDRWALAIALNGLSASHRDYLAAGGVGFLLGDGRLDYGPESVFETYYNWQVASLVTLSLDYQLVVNPGYNMDRGPASVLGARVHFEF